MNEVASRARHAIVPLTGLALLSGCGAGTAAMLGASGDDGGGTPPAITAFQVENPKVAPADLRFESNANLSAELFFAAPDVFTGEKPMLVEGPGASGNQVQLPIGVSHFEWHFDEVQGGLGGTAYVKDVDLFVRYPNGTLISGGNVKLGMGNDPPVMLLVEPQPTDPSDPSESSGIVEVRLGVRDSSSDVVAIHVQWRRASEPDTWHDATAAGVFPTGVETVDEKEGVEFSFFWNTNVDLVDGDDDVVLRVTADDGTFDADGVTPIGESEPLESALFHVDNNEEPIVQLDSGPLILNGDGRRGIPIPFRVIDEEGDPVEVIFQWRRENEGFPELPTADPTALDALLADGIQRRESRICTPYPHYAKGRVAAIDETSVRLPELGASESWTLASELVGRTLELLRPSSIPMAASDAWPANPLEAPVAALPLRDGLTALVLESTAGGGRLREIELATGAIVREFATLTGTPTAMTAEVTLDGDRAEPLAVLVARDVAGLWRMSRVELATAKTDELAFSDGSHAAPVRGIASLGTSAALFTVGSALLSVDYRDRATPVVGTILENLATPWGVAVDPTNTHRVYLAERDAVRPDGIGRVLALELCTREGVPVFVNSTSLVNLERPRSIALERRGRRLLATTSAQGNAFQLVGVDLGASGHSSAFAIGTALSTEVASLATGRDGLRLAAMPLDDVVLVGGGLQQSRTITGHAPRAQRVTVERAFAPPPLPGQEWRIPDEVRRMRARAEGAPRSFVWDSSSDVPAAGTVFLRALPRDEEVGLVTDVPLPKQLRGALEVEPGSIAGVAQSIFLTAADLDADGDLDLVSADRRGGAGSLSISFQTTPGNFDGPPQVLVPVGMGFHPVSVAVADLDSDGDADLVSANQYGLTIFLQEALGIFDAEPRLIGAGPIVYPAASVAAADIDCDGYIDLASANSDVVGGGGSLTVFFQDGPGNFANPPLVLGDEVSIGSAVSIATADLDSDGDLDLVSANPGPNGGDNLTVFFQETPRTFRTTPLVIGGPGITDSPACVASADLDRDGDIDLVCANTGGAAGTSEVTVFFQRAHGAFDASPLSLAVPDGGAATFVDVADLGADGTVELFCAALGRVLIFTQRSPGSFDPAPRSIAIDPETYLFSAVEDLDLDGGLDLICAGVTPRVFLSNTVGDFDVDPQVLGGPPVAQDNLCVAAADFDADGDLDLAAGSRRNESVILLDQRSPGSFALRSVAPIPFLGAVSVAPADIDSDGDMDLACTNAIDLMVLLQDDGVLGNKRITLAVPGGPPDEGPAPTFIAAADLDSDGAVDLVSANSSADSLTVYFQSAEGGFEPTPLVLEAPPLLDGANCVVTTDLDADGDLDLVCSSGGSFPDFAGYVTIYYQTATRVFEPSLLAEPPTVLSPASVAVADLDGDGDMDVVSANALGDDLTVFFQGAARKFTSSPLVLTAGGFPSSVAVADLDGDGDQDLASANQGSSSLTVFFQSAPGAFEAPIALGSFPTLWNPSSIKTVDLDGDGDTDLVSANNNGGGPTVFWGSH